MSTADSITLGFDGQAPEVAVSKDIIRRGLMVATVLIAIAAVIWGSDGAW